MLIKFEKVMMQFTKGRWVRFVFNPFEDVISSGQLTFSGTYAIIIDGSLNYVGHSWRVGPRLKAHDLAVGFSAKSKMVIAIRKEVDEERAYIEHKFIERFKPPANKKNARNPLEKSNKKTEANDDLFFKLLGEIRDQNIQDDEDDDFLAPRND